MIAQLNPRDRALLERVSTLLETFGKQPPKWVKVHQFKQATGYDDNQVRAFRRNSPQAWKKDESGYWYDLNALNILDN